MSNFIRSSNHLTPFDPALPGRIHAAELAVTASANIRSRLRLFCLRPDISASRKATRLALDAVRLNRRAILTLGTRGDAQLANNALIQLELEGRPKTPRPQAAGRRRPAPRTAPPRSAAEGPSDLGRSSLPDCSPRLDPAS